MTTLGKIKKQFKPKPYTSPDDDVQLKQSLQERDIHNGKETVIGRYLHEPMNENRVVLLGLGHHVRGSLMYILDELNHNPRYAHLEIIVRTYRHNDEEVQEFIRSRGWERTTTVFEDGKYGKAMVTAKYLLTEVFFPWGWIPREGQVVINIWHGTPLKKLGLSMHTRTLHYEGVSQRNFIASDYLLYPNDYTREHMLESFRVTNLMHGKALMLGYPRTAGLLDTSQEEVLREKLAPAGERLYAYMPTWRDHLDDTSVLALTKPLLDHLDAHFRDDQLLYVNLHHKISGQIDYSSYRHIRAFPADVDSYRLLSVTDALITDYSSVFFDYLAAGKNIVLYCPDLEEYEAKRGMYFDIRSLPFPLVDTPQAVLDALNAGKTYDDTAVRQKFNAWDSPQNAAKLCQLFASDESGLELLPIDADDRRRILLHSESLGAGAATDLLKAAYEKMDRTAFEPFVSCDVKSVDRNLDSAYPFLSECAVLGLDTPVRYSKAGKKNIIAYSEHRKSLPNTIEALRPDLQANFRRYYCTDGFDTIVVFDDVDTEKLMMYHVSGIRLMVIAGEDMVRSMAGGNRMLRQLLSLMLRQGKTIYAADRKTKKELRRLLPDYSRSLVRTVDTVQKLLSEL